MIGKNWKYKWLNLSDDNALSQRLVITDVIKNVNLRTRIFDKQNYHWSTATPTLASGRLYTFSFTIFGDREQRYIWQRALEDFIKPEFNPWKTDWLYTLEWTTDWWEEVITKASVYKCPRYDDTTPWNMSITGTFELYAPIPNFTSKITKHNDWWYWRKGWFKMDFKTPFKMDELLWEFSVENLWNWQADTRIEVIWFIDNPRIKNLTNDTFYWLNGSYSNLVLDWTWKGFTATDNGIDVRANRMSGSEIVRIEPWENALILTWTDFNYTSDVEIKIFYKDTYL